MTGMKKGAGEDPFEDDTDTTESESGSESNSTSDLPSSEQDDIDVATKTIDSGSSASDRNSTSRESRQRSMQIPYKFRRDGVQDGRDRVPLFLQEETKRAEREAVRELQDRFDEKVALTDLREALVKVGLEQLDDVELQLEEWGYGITFDE